MTKDEKREANIADIRKNGPGLRYTHHKWVVAKILTMHRS